MNLTDILLYRQFCNIGCFIIIFGWYRNKIGDFLEKTQSNYYLRRGDWAIGFRCSAVKVRVNSISLNEHSISLFALTAPYFCSSTRNQVQEMTFEIKGKTIARQKKRKQNSQFAGRVLRMSSRHLLRSCHFYPSV